MEFGLFHTGDDIEHSEVGFVEILNINVIQDVVFSFGINHMTEFSATSLL